LVAVVGGSEGRDALCSLNEVAYLHRAYRLALSVSDGFVAKTDDARGWVEESKVVPVAIDNAVTSKVGGKGILKRYGYVCALFEKPFAQRPVRS